MPSLNGKRSPKERNGSCFEIVFPDDHGRSVLHSFDTALDNWGNSRNADPPSHRSVLGCHIYPPCVAALLRKKRYPRTLQQIAAGLILGSVRAAEKLLMETASFNSVLGSSALRSYCRRLCTQGKKGTHSVTGFDNVSTSNRKAMQRARVVLDLFFLLLTLSCLGFALYRSLH